MPATTVTQARTLIFAIVCGVTTANAYYAQPLLDLMAADLHASTAQVSLLVTTGQVGAGIGLLFVVPAADIVRRRTLLTVLFIANTLALAGSAIAPSAAALALLALVIGVGAVAIPIITAYVASLTDDTSRGRAIGVVMGGVLFGILLSRTVASLIAAAAGWRAVYVVAAVVMTAATLVVRAAVANTSGSLRLPYLTQVRSVLTQFGRYQVLRTRCFLGLCVMATFTAFWTSVTFLLARPPYGYSQLAIGVFALSGAAGALVASTGGGMIDRYRHRRWQFSGAALVVLGLSFGVLALGKSTIVWLVVGAVVMDAAIQAIHVTNQSVVYEVDQQSQARLASGYMTSFAVGGVLGSYLSAQAFVAWGWYGSCAVGACFSIAGLVVWAFCGAGERAAQVEIRRERVPV